MKKLIINADDLGYREEINKGIMFAHQNGLVTSASLFVERDGTADALRFLKETPSLGVGIHLDLDKYFEVDHHLGIILGWRETKHDIGAVAGEVNRQIQKFSSFGLSADHLDSHHHAHMIDEVFTVVCDAAAEHKIPVVRFDEKHFVDPIKRQKMRQYLADKGLRCIDHFIEGWYWGNVDESYNVAELMTHPGYGELWREAELAHCCQPQLKQYFIDQKIELLRFSDAFSS
ncbi:MAG: ChbG/HpnK family deacetylase [Endomicrobiales bacterium]|nr:ChbG/HpnK family deacetylase [Endomicrobiales bacterium]